MDTNFNYKPNINNIFIYENNFNDFFELKKFFRNKTKNSIKSDVRVLNYNNINKFVNVGFKSGFKKSIFINVNKFSELFFSDLVEKHNLDINYKNLCDLIFEKKFFFSLEYLLPIMLNKYEVMFNIKSNKIIKNLKKLKRKPLQNQIIYIKKNKRLNFLCKFIFVNLNKSKKHFLFEKLNSFFFDDVINYEKSILLERKEILYKKLSKSFKKNN